MYKLLALLVVALFAFSACGGDSDYDFRVALLAHSPDSILDDGSFNSGAMAGIQRAVATHGLSEGQVQFFQPRIASDDERINMMRDIIEDWGADIIVMPGFNFVTSAYIAQDMFPNTRFILLDATPHDGADNVRIAPNLVSVHYAEHESGFLAGYAAVMEGYRNLGFTGGVPIPPVQRFGHGFVQGAEHAANVLGLAQGDVTIEYLYFGQFGAQPEFNVRAASLFASGTEVIFTAAGGANHSVFAAAEAAGASSIGVDADQSGYSSTVITSAVKGLEASVYALINDHLNNTWRGAEGGREREITFDASTNGVGLVMGANNRMTNFTQAQYDSIFAQIASGAIRVNSSLTMSDILSNVNLVVVNEM